MLPRAYTTWQDLFCPGTVRAGSPNKASERQLWPQLPPGYLAGSLGLAALASYELLL